MAQEQDIGILYALRFRCLWIAVVGSCPVGCNGAKICKRSL